MHFSSIFRIRYGKMKKILLFVLILSLSLVMSGCKSTSNTESLLKQIQKRDKLLVGVKYDTKPFGYIDENHELKGYDIDLSRAIAKSILGDEKKVEFKQVTPSNRILALNSGQIDMIVATMTVTPQRAQVVEFSQPYYNAGQAILVPNGSKIKGMSDLNGKRVIVVFGSTAEKNLRQIAPDAIISGYKTYTDAYSALKNGRADAIISDDTILLGFAINDPRLHLLPKRFSKEPYAVAFKKGEASASLKNRVDIVIKDMQSNGELAKLKTKWVKF